METILRIPDLSHYNISDHLEFHQLSYAICDNYLTKAGNNPKVGQTVKIVNPDDLVIDYHDALTQEDSVYKWLRKSEYTGKKAEVDQARDNTAKNINYIVRMGMKHYDPAVRDSALHVNNLLEVYGNLPKADYDAETAAIDNLVTRLRGSSYQAAVTKLGLDILVDQLDSENTLFKTYVDDTAQEQLAKPNITPKAARNQTDGALHKCTSFVNAVIVLMGGEDFLAGFVAEYNVLVNHYNTLVREHYGRLHARIDITPAIIDTIPEQHYTGKPVFVIPELTLTVEREGKQTVLHLLFSEDFSVAYRNNVEPGTATLIIKGIGKYTGEITTTFNIVRS
jgi:hypothetical protein